MQFNSWEFALFLPLVVLVYFSLPTARWAWLLATSCFFYMFFVPEYILILFLTITVDYWAGILIEESEGLTRKAFLLASILPSILVPHPATFGGYSE